MLIGEVSARSGLSRRMLRHYDELGLVSPSARSATGYREYSRADLTRLLHVESLRSLGLSLADVARALDDPEYRAEETMGELVESSRRRIAEERQLLAHLESVAASAPESWDDVLGLVAKLRALRGESPRARQRVALDASGDLDIDGLVQARTAESEPNVAGALDWAIARAGTGALAALREAAQSDDERTRARTVRAIASIDGEESSRLLRVLLADSSSRVRAGAALALGGRGDDVAAEELVAMVVEGRNDVDAAELLGELASAGAGYGGIIREIMARLHTPGLDPEPRRRIVQALAEIPGDEVDAELRRLSDDADPQVAFTARAIATLRSGTARP